MYLQSKFGFVEADAWDGSPLPAIEHDIELRNAVETGTPRVIVTRSRKQETIVRLLELVAPQRRILVLESPPTWDYQWRAYLTVEEWAEILSYVAFNLDYRNFKSWCGQNADADEIRLARGIWHEAHDAVFPPPVKGAEFAAATLQGELQRDFDHAQGALPREDRFTYDEESFAQVEVREENPPEGCLDD